MTPSEMCIEAEVICMELCEARKRGINLMSVQKYGNVSQGAGPENKDGWESEEGRASFARGELCVWVEWTDATVTVRPPLTSGVASVVLSVNSRPDWTGGHRPSIPRPLWPLLPRETNTSADAFLTKCFRDGEEVWLFFSASWQMSDLPQQLKQMFALGSYFPGECTSSAEVNMRCIRTGQHKVLRSQCCQGS